MILIGMHSVVDQGHHEQNDQNHSQVDGMEDGLGDRSLIGHFTKGLTGNQVQGDGAGETSVPDNEAGVSRSDQQGIVDIANTLSDLLGQQSAGNKTEAPVQPAADGGDEGGDDDSLLLVVSHIGDSAQSLLTGLGRSHGVTKHQNQSHLHGEGQQTPEALVVAPCVQHRNGTHAGSQHSAQEDDDGQDHSEQEGVRQPTVDYAYAAICELFEHSTHSFFCF